MRRLQKGFFYKIKTIAWAIGAQFISPGALLSDGRVPLWQLKPDITHSVRDKCSGPRIKTVSVLSEGLYRRFRMKWGVCFLPLALVMTGCASVEDINETLPTMSVISGKNPHEYAQCLGEKLADSRGALQVEPQKDGVRVIVPQKLSSGPAAVFDIEDRAGGSSIKLHERISNVPVRPWDVRNAATACISG
jgi:hypothetical protein